MALVSAHPNDARGTDLRFADAIGTDTPYPVNVLCVNANDTVQLMDQLGAEVIGAHYTIGFWFWELARLPDAWLGAVDRVDEIWVASGFVAETMRATHVQAGPRSSAWPWTPPRPVPIGDRSSAWRTTPTPSCSRSTSTRTWRARTRWARSRRSGRPSRT